MRQQATVILIILMLPLLAIDHGLSDAHQHPCHRHHSCPSDHGTYVCGDLGHCSQCPDNAYCQGGKPRSAGSQQLLPPSPVPKEEVLTAPVLTIVDGDTIDVRLEGRTVRVRYIGVNTPETKHPKKGVEPFGKEAAEANRRLVEGKTVRLELDVEKYDRYRRLLAYVYVDDTMINAELVRQGYAQVATYPPNVKYQELFLTLQREAREAKRGLWGTR
jgi:micrococcal nuclease